MGRHITTGGLVGWFLSQHEAPQLCDSDDTFDSTQLELDVRRDYRRGLMLTLAPS